MPTLGAPLDFAKLEGRNFQAHQLGTAPGSPVKGQLYYNTGDNTLYWWDGTTWVSAKGGVSSIPDASPTVKGIVQLAGDLSGTAASPQIAPGVITDTEVAAANKDGVVGLASMRTLGAGAQQAMPGNRTLDAITPPAADVNLNGKKITNVAAPVAVADGVNKGYVDSIAQGLDAKNSVRLATTTNINLANAPSSIDGVALVSGDRVLVKNQTLPQENGIYNLQDGPPWIAAREQDANTWAELVSAYVWVEVGSTNADTGWVSTADAGGTLGTTPIPWTQFAGAGAVGAGAGLTKTGTVLDVGQGTGILVAADSVSVDPAIIPRYYSSATHGAGTSIVIPQSTHGCRASRGLIVMTVVEATGAEVLADVSIAANGDVTVTFAASQSANTIRVTVIG